MFVAALSCGGGGDGGDSITDPKPTQPAVATVVVSQDTATLVPSATIQLAATVKAGTGQTLSREVVWAASDTSKASVSPSGLVTAIRAGSTLVTASTEGHSASATITVLDGAIVSTGGAVLHVQGGVVQLAVPSGAVGAPIALFANASTDTTMSARVVHGTSFDFGPTGTIFAKPVPLTIQYDASMLQSGVNESALQLYLRGKSSWQVVDGSVIDVQAKTVTAPITHFSTYAILVSGAVAAVTVGPAGKASGDSVVSMVVGSQLQFSATLHDVDGNTLTGRVATWSTSDSTIGTVSASGLVKVLKAGTTTITATSEGKSGSLRIAASQAAVASITLGVDSPFAANATSQIFAEVKDANGNVLTGRVVSWTSSAPSVATIAQDGRISGVAAGTTTITATSEGISASTIITVTPALAATGLTLLNPQPLVERSRVPFPAPTVVALVDSVGNVVREAGRVITVSFSHAGGTLSGTLTATTGVDGRATFSNLILADTVGQYNLDFASAGLAGMSPVLKLSAGMPAHIYVYIPSSLQANPGQSLGSLQVQVKDADGNPVFNVPVTFTPTPANGTSVAGPATVPSSADGFAQIEGWTAGPNVGVDSLLVTAAGMSGPPAVFVVNIVPVPRILSIVRGDHQIATTDGTVPLRPSVSFTTQPDGHPIVGVAVTFSVTAGGGSVSGGSATTDAAGVATVGSWSLGPVAGANTLSATAPDATNGEVTYTATSVEPFALRELAAGTSWTCGLSATNDAYCWGANADGQLGDGSTTDRTKPVHVVSGLTFASISVAGGFGGHTCAVSTAGTGYCWGRNSSGQLGDGTTTASSTPVAVAGGLTFQSISVGLDFSCGLSTAGSVYCWGDNTHKQLGIGLLPEQESVPVPINGGISFRNISAGTQYACGVAIDGAGYCWGYDGNGVATAQGDRIVQQLVDATPMAGGVSFQSISAGTTGACGISTTSIAYCWGDNAFGQLGVASVGNRKSGFPLAVDGGMTFATIKPGGSHTCGVTSAGAAYCWGLGTKGAVGAVPPVAFSYTSPTAVAGAGQFITIAAGYTHACGATAQAVYCWGANEHGQLGDESVSNHDQMVPVHKP